METISAFFGYVVGGLIGSIICVACDRLWRLYENKVRVDVTIVSVSDFDHVALHIAIVNKGSVALPPSELVLLIETEKDKAWSMRGFEPHRQSSVEVWWPTQQKSWTKNLTHNGKVNAELKDIHDEYPAPHSVKLSLLPNGSARPLWESEELGQSVLAHLRAAFEQGKFPEGLPHKRHLKYETWGEMAQRILRRPRKS